MMKRDSKRASGEELMKGDYLWDGTGKPDPEVQRLETLLSPFRHSENTLVIPAQVAVQPGKLRGLWLPMPCIPQFAAAAVVLIALVAGVTVSFLPTGSPQGALGWEISRIEGSPQIGTVAIRAGTGNARLLVGQTIETNAASRASISDGDVGNVEIEPNSRVRLVQMDKNRKRIQLDVGTIHAAIWAPAGQFVVDTPSAIAVDLGCAYTLQVASDGSGTIRTTLGWVGFRLNGRDSFIPAGALCATRPRRGPGVPYFEDASETFREAVAQFDAAAANGEVQEAALSTMLAQARARDALSLWHLLSRTEGAERERVYERMSALAPPPASVTREGVLQLNQSMLDQWWNALGLGDIAIWRYWEQSSSPGASAGNQAAEKKQQFLKKVR